MAFYSGNPKKDVILTKEDEEHYKNKIVCRFREKEILIDKVRDHRQITGKYRGVAHNNCNINVTQKQSSFFPFALHIFSNYDCQLFFMKLITKKNDKVKFDIISKTNEEYNEVTDTCIRFIDSYRLSSMSLNGLVKTLDSDDFNFLKKEFPDKWNYLNSKLAYSCEFFSSLEYYQKFVVDFKKVNFLSNLKTKILMMQK